MSATSLSGIRESWGRLRNAPGFPSREKKQSPASGNRKALFVAVLSQPEGVPLLIVGMAREIEAHAPKEPDALSPRITSPPSRSAKADIAEP